ncbi:MAG: CBS domain-containing protein [bacterium]|nr:MAG: CBS domain-containing protein [bacterium]
MEVITTHLNADFDAMASMIAARKIHPEAKMVFPGSQEKNLREFMARSPLAEYPFHRIRDIDLDAVTRLILVDIKIPGRLGPLDEVARREGVELIIYDHHPRTDQDYKGSVEIVDNVGATATLLVEELRRRRKRITPEEATILTLGIYEDTGSLTFTSTTPRDLDAVSFLVKKGARLDVIPTFIGRELDARQVQLLNDLLNSTETLDVQGVSVSVATASTEEYIPELALLVHKMMDMEGFDVLFTLVRMEERVILVARSRVPEVDVAKVAEEFGGGGHPTAASGSIREKTLVQVKEELTAILPRVIGRRKTASSLMSSPVISVGLEDGIAWAAEIMTRYNINGLPVMDGEKNMSGIITRGVVERAIHHGLSDSPVKDYMLTDFQSVSPDDPLEMVQEHIVERHQRMLPVMEGRKVRGVITRTDLLEAMHDEFKMSKAYEEFKGSQESSLDRVRNISELMREILDRRTLKVLRTSGEVADAMGFRAYLVGGLVRDILLRIRNQDVDLVVEGDGVEFGRRLARRLKARIRTHRKFKTAVVILPDGFKVDVATARTEYYEFPGAHPMVERGSIKLDLYRRDFSINALAIKLNPGSFGLVVDFFGGQRDLKEKTVRILHNLSFIDDPTRIIRAVRFEQKFGFRIGRHTQYLLKGAVSRGYLAKAQGPRLLMEIMAILREDHPSRSFERMEELGILEALHPALAFDRRTREVFTQVEKIHSWFQFLYLEEEPEIADIYFNATMLLKDTDARSEILLGFQVPAYRREEYLERWGRIADTLRALARVPEGSPSWIARQLRDLTTEDLIVLMALTKKEGTARAVSLYLSRLRFLDMEIDGKVLKKMGYATGPIFRRIMDAVRDARVDGEVKTLEEEIEWVKENFPLEGKKVESRKVKGKR